MGGGGAADAARACKVFVTGGSGYVGRPLLAALQARGHGLRALVRPVSAHALPQGVQGVIGDALLAHSFRDAVAPCDTLVQLVGTRTRIRASWQSSNGSIAPRHSRRSTPRSRPVCGISST